MADKVIESFIELLRLGLWDDWEGNFSNFPLSDDEWSLLYDIAISQTVEGLVYEGLLKLPTDYLPPRNLLMRWVARIDTIERGNKKISEIFSLVSKGFAKNNISFFLLKGLGLGINYDKPLIRVSGDIDLYFPDLFSYDKSNKLLRAKGYKVQKGDHNSTHYSFHGIEIEHHTRMVDLFNPFVQKYLKELEHEEEKNSITIEVNGAIAKTPSYLMAQIQANAHIIKHYMGFGVGLRQFCDVARLCITQPANFDGNILKEKYKRLGIEKWMDLMHNFLVEVLGLSPDKVPYPIEKKYDTKRLLKDVLASGNFGFHDVRFRNADAKLSERYSKRDKIHKRILPHIILLLRYTPSEVVWFPLMKLYTKLTGR